MYRPTAPVLKRLRTRAARAPASAGTLVLGAEVLELLGLAGGRGRLLGGGGGGAGARGGGTGRPPPPGPAPVRPPPPPAPSSSGTLRVGGAPGTSSGDTWEPPQPASATAATTAQAGARRRMRV